MQVNKFKIGLLSAAAVLGLGVFSSCSKDFQGDIDGINNRIDKLEGLSANVDALKKAVEEGKIIQSVEKTDNGIKIVVGGKTYEITNGKDGINGKDGASATVTIDEETGFWVINGEKTKFPSRGVAGKDGKDGKDGKVGKDGVYYVPGTNGAEKGFWVKVDPNTLDDKGMAKRTVTEDKWLPEGTVTAVFENGVLTLYNVKGGEGDAKAVTINPALTSLEVKPDFVLHEDEPIVVFDALTSSCECVFGASSTQTITMIVNSGATEDDVKAVKLLYNDPKRLIDPNLRTAAIAPEVVGKPVFSEYPGNPGVKLMTISFRIDAFNTNRVLTIDRDGMPQLELRSFWDNERGFYEVENVDVIYVAAQNRYGAWVTSNAIEVAAREISTDDLKFVRTWKTPQYEFPTTEEEAEEILTNLVRNLPEKATDFAQAMEPRVIQVPYGESFDLAKEVRAYIDHFLTDQEMADYDIKLEWDLLNENGEKIAFAPDRNQTPQQEFIQQIEGSVFQAKVYDLNPNLSAVGRTPIVHARYVICENKGSDASSDICKGDDCPIDMDGHEGDVCKKDIFLPLFIALHPEKPVGEESNLLLVRDLKKIDYCEDFIDILTTKEMNTLIYHEVTSKMGIPYTVFTADYKLLNTSIEANKALNKGTNYVGYFTEIMDPEDQFNTNRLAWVLTPEELYKYRGQEIKGRAIYSDGLNTVYVIFKAMLPKVEFNAQAMQLQTLWTENYTAMLLNSQVPDENRKTDETYKVTYMSYLENGFKNLKTDIDEDPDKLELDGTVVAERMGLNNFRYWFGFTKDQTPLVKGNITYKLIAKEATEDTDGPVLGLMYSNLSGDGLRDGQHQPEYVFRKTYTQNDCPECAGAHRRHYTQLWAVKYVDGKPEKDDAGKIAEHLVIGLSGENNSFYEVNSNDEIAKEILNTDSQFLKAKLQLFVMDDCDHCISVKGLLDGGDTFKAIFQRPLEITAANKDKFVNGVNRGTKFAKVDLNDKFDLTDWRINSLNAENKKMAKFKDHKWYINYYDVQVSIPSADNIREVIKLQDFLDREGNPVVKPVPSMNFNYIPSTDPNKPFGVLEYWNNDNSIMKDFKILMPVTITYKYGTYSTYFEIPVECTAVTPQE